MKLFEGMDKFFDNANATVESHGQIFAEYVDHQRDLLIAWLSLSTDTITDMFPGKLRLTPPGDFSLNTKYDLKLSQHQVTHQVGRYFINSTLSNRSISSQPLDQLNSEIDSLTTSLSPKLGGEVAKRWVHATTALAMFDEMSLPEHSSAPIRPVIYDLILNGFSGYSEKSIQLERHGIAYNIANTRDRTDMLTKLSNYIANFN